MSPVRKSGLHKMPVAIELARYVERVCAYISQQVETLNGHKLWPDEILNIDETGFDLCNCVKTMRVIIKSYIKFAKKGLCMPSIAGPKITHAT